MLEKKLDHLEKAQVLVHNDVNYCHSPTSIKIKNTSQAPVMRCTVCAVNIEDHVPEYYAGEPLNPICEECQQDANLLESDLSLNPFSSIPVHGIPISLVSHWILPNDGPHYSFSTLPTLMAHYVQIPTPGSKFLSMEEVLEEMNRIMDQQRKDNGCVKS